MTYFGEKICCPYLVKPNLTPFEQNHASAWILGLELKERKNIFELPRPTANNTVPKAMGHFIVNNAM
jgi:hypothetical protein